jgi:transcriptional regulator with XRE-family HTH domain
MKERILEFLKYENKSSAQLAEEIGVQASGISHILSGRNNPSLDFVLKMLEKYQFLSSDWLLFGKGSMYKESKMQNLFDYEPVDVVEKDKMRIDNEPVKPETSNNMTVKNISTNDPVNPQGRPVSDIVKIIWFFKDRSFEEFLPRG